MHFRVRTSYGVVFSRILTTWVNQSSIRGFGMTLFFSSLNTPFANVSELTDINSSTATVYSWNVSDWHKSTAEPYQIVFITQWRGHSTQDDLNTCLDQSEFDRSCQHVLTTSFEIPVDGQTIFIDVELNRDLVTTVLKKTVFNSAGIGATNQEPLNIGNLHAIKSIELGLGAVEITTFPQLVLNILTFSNVSTENCYYRGRVRHSQRSLVVVSTCHGLRGLILMNDDVYHVYPQNMQLLYSQIPHKVVKTSRPRPLPFGSVFAMFQPYQELQQHVSECLRNVKISKPQLNAMMRRKRRLRVAFVSDLLLKQQLESFNVSSHRFFLDLANMLNAFLQEINGTSLSLVYVEVWNSTKAFSKPTSPRWLMSEFLGYRLTEMKDAEFDMAHFFTSRKFDHMEYGMAIPDSICTPRAVSVSQVVDVQDLLLVAFDALHAILHILGIERSVSDACPCGMTSLCVAEPVSTSRLMWLPGSARGFLQSALTRLDVCLYDKTAAPTYIQVCGNGIVERGEECDCADREECRNSDPCCDPELCLLVPWATCRYGECCQNCTLRLSSDVCRPPSNECDVPEFCDGKSGQCPVDSLVQDGQECLTGVGSCYRGDCVSYDFQCQMLWGSEAASADDNCYETFNVAGSFDGHCGQNSETGSYAHCNLRDVKCGLLHCTGGSSRPLLGQRHMMSMSTGVSNGKQYECKIVNGEHTDGGGPLGLVQDGSVCSKDGLCLRGECVNISIINPLTCPIDENGNVCSGNGVCTTEVQCYCSHGFAGADCARRINRIILPTAQMATSTTFSLVLFTTDNSSSTDNSSAIFHADANMRISNTAGVGAVWLLVILASIIIVAIILFLACLVCYRRRSPPVRRKHHHKSGSKGRSTRTNQMLITNNSSRVKFHNDLPSYRAYKLRHFLRGSGASETESDKSCQQRVPDTAETDGTDALPPTAPLSAVDRLSLNPERGILKNSSTNSISRRAKEVSTAITDSKCETVVGESRGLDNVRTSKELTESVTRTDIDPPCVYDKCKSEVIGDVTGDIHTQPSQLPVSTMPQPSPSFAANKLRTSPVPNSIPNSSVN